MDMPTGQQWSLVLGVGITYGVLQGTNNIKQTKAAGSAKILDVV